VLVGSVVSALRRTVCPQCQMPWLQYALGEKGAGAWLSWLTTFTQCPQCRYTVEDVVNSSLGHTWRRGVALMWDVIWEAGRADEKARNESRSRGGA